MTPDVFKKGFLWGYGNGSIDDSNRILVDRYFVTILKKKGCDSIFCFPTSESFKLILCPPMFHNHYHKFLMRNKQHDYTDEIWETLYFKSGRKTPIERNGRCNISFIVNCFSCHLTGRIQYVGQGLWLEAWDQREWKNRFRL